MNIYHKDRTKFSPEKKDPRKRERVCYYLYIRYLLSHVQKNKQTIYYFNDIQAPGLHIIQYRNIYKTVIIMMIVI